MPQFHTVAKAGEKSLRLFVNSALIVSVLEDDAGHGVLHFAAPEVSLVKEVDDDGKPTGRLIPRGGLYWTRVDESYDDVVDALRGQGVL